VEKLNRENLWSLEQYHDRRPAFRTEVIEHKKNRRVALGPNATLCFEDFLTMKYQVQEMLRVERIFQSEDIAEEIAAYNPLIPDGSNWKATLMIEFPDVDERRVALTRLVGVEHKVWTQAGDSERRYAFANEDMERSTEEKTAAVHFLRFELTPEDIAIIKSGGDVRFGIDHAGLQVAESLDPVTRQSLAEDLD
jgi:hypothetical protein